MLYSKIKQMIQQNKSTDEWRKPAPKKSLRWAENLESVAENSSKLLVGSSPSLGPLLERDLSISEEFDSRSSRKMRRSYSTSDMNKYLLLGQTAEEESSVLESQASLTSERTGDSMSSTMILSTGENAVPYPGGVQNQSDESIPLNLTYDKSGTHLLTVNNSSSQNGISPSKVVNSSFMETSSILAGSTGQQMLSINVNFNVDKVFLSCKKLTHHSLLNILKQFSETK